MCRGVRGRLGRACFAGTARQPRRPAHVRLPARAYWLEPAGPGRGDVAAAGLGAAGHPLLGAAVELADADGVSCSPAGCRLQTHPWLADHAVSGTVLLPGTAFVELALARR